MLIKKLEENFSSGIYPMHMPGHKRNTEFLSMMNPYALDITEIDNFDNLHDANGILRDGMERLAKIYSSKKSFYLVNGSTCGLIAGIASAVKKGDEILVARNCHKAVYHAIELLNLHPVYIMPPVIEEYGIAGSVRPSEIEKALKENPNIKLIVITSPTYEGVVSDISEIAKIAHENNIPLLVDEAHGAHFGFSPFFPDTAVHCGADIVIQSFHKTLPSFTQTAVLHYNSSLISLKNLQHQLRVFQTSSPSYLFMASIDNCVELLNSRGDELFKSYEKHLTEFSKRMENLKNTEVLCFGKNELKNHPDIFNFDMGKIVISTRNTSMSGGELANVLLSKYKIQLEMSSTNYAIAMTSICDTDEGFNRLSTALLEIDNAVAAQTSDKIVSSYTFPTPEIVKTPSEVQYLDGKFTNLNDSEGRISKEYVYAYPPGIPLLAPGERVTEEFLLRCSEMAEHGVTLHSESGAFPETIETVK